MYLSRVFLQPEKLDNAYEWHRSLWSLFPDTDKGESSPFLFRIERLDLSVGAEVLLQSSVKPLETKPQANVLATKALNLVIGDGQPLRFYLQANPTKKITDRDNPHRKIRVPLIQEEQQNEWLQRKLESSANVDGEILVQKNQPTYFRKGARVGKIASVNYQGVLIVKNGRELSRCMGRGIGPAKAFGCGLLTLAKL